MRALTKKRKQPQRRIPLGTVEHQRALALELACKHIEDYGCESQSAAYEVEPSSLPGGVLLIASGAVGLVAVAIAHSNQGSHLLLLNGPHWYVDLAREHQGHAADQECGVAAPVVDRRAGSCT